MIFNNLAEFHLHTMKFQQKIIKKLIRKQGKSVLYEVKMEYKNKKNSFLAE
ncbi:MAG: hypothetical protein ACJA1N_000405 [Saprospiraceae bacterium]|jgi:hypothetical protein